MADPARFRALLEAAGERPIDHEAFRVGLIGGAMLTNQWDDTHAAALWEALPNEAAHLLRLARAWIEEGEG